MDHAPDPLQWVTGIEIESPIHTPKGQLIMGLEGVIECCYYSSGWVRWGVEHTGVHPGFLQDKKDIKSQC